MNGNNSQIETNKKSGSKKLPWVKLCLASASLLILILASKNLFASSSKTLAVSPHSESAPAVLGDQVFQTQVQPPAAASTTPTPAPTQVPTPESAPAVAPLPVPVTKNLKIKATPTGFLNVRLQPSLVSPVISKVYPGEIHAYTSTQDGWYLIQLKSKHYGWVNAEYVAVITNN